MTTVERDAGPHLGARLLIERAAAAGSVSAVVVEPVKPHVLESVVAARRIGLIEPVLVGSRVVIEAAAATVGVGLDGLRIIEATSASEAVGTALDVVAAGEAQVLVKGSLRTDQLMGGVLQATRSTRTGRLSHVFACYPPPGVYHKPLLVTDGALNIAPDLDSKCAILGNAVTLAAALGVPCPKVAVLAATESVSSGMEATLHAAALSVMASRGDLGPAIVEGPLALDVALSRAAAEIKGIHSTVAGDADILLVPSIEVGNAVVKLLALVEPTVVGGVIVGGGFPVVLPSRSDSAGSRVLACAVAALMARSSGGV